MSPHVSETLDQPHGSVPNAHATIPPTFRSELDVKHLTTHPHRRQAKKHTFRSDVDAKEPRHRAKKKTIITAARRRMLRRRAKRTSSLMFCRKRPENYVNGTHFQILAFGCAVPRGQASDAFTRMFTFCTTGQTLQSSKTMRETSKVSSHSRPCKRLSSGIGKRMLHWLRAHSEQTPSTDDWLVALSASSGIVLQLAFAKGGPAGFTAAHEKLQAAQNDQDYNFLEVLNAVTETKPFSFRGRKSKKFNNNSKWKPRGKPKDSKE